MKFNLEYYRAFYMTAVFSSFTKASEKLCLTQSAVSQSVKKLEGELQCKLFHRTPRGLRLTKEGEILYKHVEKAFFELQMGEDSLLHMRRAQKEELRIGITETALRYFLVSQLARIKEEFPDLQIVLDGTTTADTCEKLHNGEIEAAFLISPIPQEYQFRLIEIRDIQDVMVAGRSFPIDHEKQYSPAEIVTYPMISVSEENSVRTYINRWFLEHGVVFQPEFKVRSTGLVLPLIQHDLGIGIIPRDFVEKEIASGELIQIEMTAQIPPRKLYLATDPLHPLSALCGRLIGLYRK